MSDPMHIEIRRLGRRYDMCDGCPLDRRDCGGSCGGKGKCPGYGIYFLIEEKKYRETKEVEKDILRICREFGSHNKTAEEGVKFLAALIRYQRCEIKDGDELIDELQEKIKKMERKRK